MASVASASPLSSGYEYVQVDAAGESDDNSWDMPGLPQNAGQSADSYYSSPANSMGSWAMISPNGQVQPSPPALSPLTLDVDQQQMYQNQVYGDQQHQQTAPFNVPAPADAQFMPAMAGQVQETQNYFLPTGNMLLDEQLHDFSLFQGMPPLTGFEQPPQLPVQSVFEQQPMPAPTTEFEISRQYQFHAEATPWDATNLRTGGSPIFPMEDPSFLTPSPPPQVSGQSQSPSVGTHASVSPASSPIQIKQETGVSEHKSQAPSTLRKVRGDARVQKRKASGVEGAGGGGGASNSRSSSSSSGRGADSQFLVVTPDCVSANAGKPNPFECFEQMRPSQRGRKGPLANATKESALQVRRLGACFCCHARKVKCDKERPCRNCKKLTMAVPQVMCWQFPDFIPVLFPEFIRGHFKKDEMSRFMTENIDSFRVDGVEKPCTVELFSGLLFTTTLTVAAKFFTAKTPEALQHWHTTLGPNRTDMQSRAAAAIGLELDGQNIKDTLRKKAREYIQALTQEPAYAEQVTLALRHTELPRKVLRIVQAYARDDPGAPPIVRRALSIYAMHYVMTHQLCLTRQSVVGLAPSKLVPQDVPWVTPRVLNRQLKSVVDEMLLREMQLLFENFGKSLKPKSRREWAPCLAAFLVLCLFMEAVETAADGFVVRENERLARDRLAPRWTRRFALDVNREVENLPFAQFAYQFHQIYQTHSRDAAARSFNPLVDDACFEQAELDRRAMEMVWQLRRLVQDRDSWCELDFLTADPILPSEEHPRPRDIPLNYTGRLVAKFLLSFTDEKYIFGQK